MKFSVKSNSELIGKAKVAINNGKDVPEIALIMAGVGYDSGKFAEGLRLINEAEEADFRYSRAMGEKVRATESFKEARDEANRKYMKHLKMARVVLPDDKGEWQKLALNGKRKRDYASWNIEGKSFYKNGLEIDEVVAKLSGIGIGREELNAGLRMFEEVENLKYLQEKKFGEAEEAANVKKKAFKGLRVWMREYITLAKLTVGEHPQWVEKLGIREKA